MAPDPGPAPLTPNLLSTFALRKVRRVARAGGGAPFTTRGSALYFYMQKYNAL